ncbi:conjugative transposon TraJ protein [human gut metagenome]|uniref:Conjugative transposon TraJ protein n=1 Tax=human gut metagenome TaxID=408170 RepID=K1U8C5_9ZZZZ
MEFDNLHQILRSLYEQMMPLCGDMAGVAKGIAGLGALFTWPTGYGSRWREPNR